MFLQISVSAWNKPVRIFPWKRRKGTGFSTLEIAQHTATCSECLRQGLRKELLIKTYVKFCDSRKAAGLNLLISSTWTLFRFFPGNFLRRKEPWEEEKSLYILDCLYLYSYSSSLDAFYSHLSSAPVKILLFFFNTIIFNQTLFINFPTKF